MPTSDGPRVAKVGSIVKAAPELRFSASGTPFAKFSISVKPYAPKDQEQSDPEFYDVTAFGSLAENVAENLTRGDRVMVIGTVKIDKWDDKQTGQPRSKKVILADAVGPDLRFCGADIHRETRAERGLPPRQAQPAPLEYDDGSEPF